MQTHGWLPRTSRFWAITVSHKRPPRSSVRDGPGSGLIMRRAGLHRTSLGFPLKDRDAALELFHSLVASAHPEAGSPAGRGTGDDDAGNREYPAPGDGTLDHGCGGLRKDASRPAINVPAKAKPAAIAHKIVLIGPTATPAALVAPKTIVRSDCSDCTTGSILSSASLRDAISCVYFDN